MSVIPYISSNVSEETAASIFGVIQFQVICFGNWDPGLWVGSDPDGLQVPYKLALNINDKRAINYEINQNTVPTAILTAAINLVSQSEMGGGEPSYNSRKYLKLISYRRNLLR